MELSLWMESERMLHPVIRQEDRIELQEGVVKEEKNFRLDNAPMDIYFMQLEVNYLGVIRMVD